jgi:hypothetical protein
MPMQLNDAEMDLLHRLALPIAPARRSEFLAAVALELETAGGVGEGAVHRVARQLQRQFWEPPQFSADASAPRHLAARSA